MPKHLMHIEISKKEVDEIMQELEKAYRVIYSCYCKLQDLEAVDVKE